jgi:hypothetical protein
LRFPSDHFIKKDLKTHIEPYHIWDFKFNPPPLANVKISVSGWHDFSRNSFFVWEIWELKNIPSSVSEEIDFIHPNYEQAIGGRATRRINHPSEPPQQYELNDDELSDIDRAPIELQSDNVTVSFADAFLTHRVSSKTRTLGHNIKGDEENIKKEIWDNKLSVNEKENTGSLPGGSWNSLNDQTDDAHLYLKKFDTFLKMIDVLEEKHSCKVISKKTMKLPKVNGSKKHWLANSQNPRCLAIIELEYKAKRITLLEIDTSDGKAKLSTIMIKNSDYDWISKNLENITKGIIKKSLNWPMDIFKNGLDQDDFSAIPHPRSTNNGKLNSKHIAPWAKRFVNWMEKMTKGFT